MSYEETPDERQLKKEGWQSITEWNRKKRVPAAFHKTATYKRPGKQGYRPYQPPKDDYSILVMFGLAFAILVLWTWLTVK